MDNVMKEKLIYFLAKYGNDFFHKLPKYTIAKYKGEHVHLDRFEPKGLSFQIVIHKKDSWEEEILWVDLFELDDFCL